MSTIVLGVFSDTHCGSTVALCPREGVHLDDGGSYHPSPAQLWLCDHWDAGWAHVERILERETKLGPTEFGFVSNGDATDGNHHKTTQILAGAEGAHIKAATECFRTPLKLGPKWVWIVRGTEVHVGKSGGLEEGLAVALDREGAPLVRDVNTNAWSWWYLPMELNGKLLDFTHHGRMGQRSHTRAGYARHFAHDLWAERVMRGEEPPHLAVRSHYHVYEDTGPSHPTRGVTRVVQMPAWQLHTAFTRKVVPESLSDIGLVAIVIRPDGELLVEPYVISPSRGEVWRP